jgi:hypothetical protein
VPRPSVVGENCPAFVGGARRLEHSCSGPEGWRPAAGGESFCVWDLRVIWWEREAYVTTVLAGRPGGVEAYVATVAEGYA